MQVYAERPKPLANTSPPDHPPSSFQSIAPSGNISQEIHTKRHSTRTIKGPERFGFPALLTSQDLVYVPTSFS